MYDKEFLVIGQNKNRDPRITVFVVGATGLEPATCWSQTSRSSLLSYTPMCFVLSLGVGSIAKLWKRIKGEKVMELWSGGVLEDGLFYFMSSRPKADELSIQPKWRDLLTCRTLNRERFLRFVLRNKPSDFAQYDMLLCMTSFVVKYL